VAPVVRLRSTPTAPLDGASTEETLCAGGRFEFGAEDIKSKVVIVAGSTSDTPVAEPDMDVYKAAAAEDDKSE